MEELLRLFGIRPGGQQSQPGQVQMPMQPQQPPPPQQPPQQNMLNSDPGTLMNFINPSSGTGPPIRQGGAAGGSGGADAGTFMKFLAMLG